MEKAVVVSVNFVRTQERMRNIFPRQVRLHIRFRCTDRKISSHLLNKELGGRPMYLVGSYPFASDRITRTTNTDG